LTHKKIDTLAHVGWVVCLCFFIVVWLDQLKFVYIFIYTCFLEYDMIIYYLFIFVAAVMPPKKGKHGSNRTATVEAPLDTQEALAAMVQVMQQELSLLLPPLLLLLVLP
jgi:hypothetical protein